MDERVAAFLEHLKFEKRYSDNTLGVPARH